jgi:hypothetical protein
MQVRGQAGWTAAETLDHMGLWEKQRRRGPTHVPVESVGPPIRVVVLPLSFPRDVPVVYPMPPDRAIDFRVPINSEAIRARMAIRVGEDDRVALLRAQEVRIPGAYQGQRV